MPGPRTLASVWAAKSAALASHALGRGGTAVSGLVGLRVQPALIEDLAGQLGHGCVIVTGTNGKTTTSRLISEIARNAGLLPLANSSGSNLMRGIASTLAQAADAQGGLPDAERRIGIFEVDEATIPLALPALRPHAVIFTNLFRDQLDRYGEVEAVAALWREALSKAAPDLSLVLNADDPTVASLGEGRQNVLYFGVDDPKLDRGAIEHASDALNCAACGSRLTYDVAYFGHIGHWRCPSCGRARPQPAVTATDVELRDGRSLAITISGHRIEMAIGGLYNVYNALAAATAPFIIEGVTHDHVEAALRATGAAFGRQEAFAVEGRRVELFLAKNPAGLNQVLSTLLLDPERHTALVILNDGIADGRDISWIWDADFEVAAGHFQSVLVSGTRAEELALRLKYAEWDEATLTVEPEIKAALVAALQKTPAGDTLTVVPTYTAMLSVREVLAKMAGRDPFWRQ
jgi:UDP-N-acetylmuramyl tripeptide synthase